MTILTGFDLCRAAVAVEAISAPEQSVLMVLAIMADKQAQCWPSIAGLVSRTKLSERSVQNAVKALAEAGHLTRKERPGHGVVYTVHPRTVCAPAQDAPPQEMRPAGDAATPAGGAPKQPRTTKPTKASPSSVPRAARATKVPADFWPAPAATSLTAKAMADWPPGEIEEQVEHFIDLHTTKGTTSLDWQASWRTWVKNWKRFNGNRPRNHRNPDELQNPMVRALRNAEAREARQGSAVVQPRLLS
ncbi:helix-turn-helix domain-containing protein [Sphingomonas yabuuchiae]|uniref:DNA-binding MarR family transcriptional regulator n=1 Tax=Sphingomonas yabuuchiae TaxID=172044 RepID=A0AA40ZYE1_9SPHN|nr:DNA-binding MarR family transcriptional regulator [Sphingomonas yabuuchiae]MBN3556771.1 helix-turn-helix domain-containing protein [Sphingomonas yabuuchiae]